jgi:ABC-type Fe3+/spermidine/putrescine transport system ATPase subunit
MTLLSVRGLTVHRARRTVLADVSFSAAAGAITAILGTAGAGKTTLLAAIAGLLPPERGAVFAGSKEITALSPRRRGIAFLPPGSVLPPSRTTHAGLRRLAPRAARAEAASLLGALSPTLAETPPPQLSHGGSHLALAAARLLPLGEILLVDEAGMGLDDPARAALGAQLRRAARSGRTVVVATRSPAVALQADHLVLLAEGQVVQTGTPASLYAEPRSEAAARLTGPANILSGRIREIRPHHFIWTSGARFLQSADPDMPRPTLGAEITFCLRPERIALLDPHEAAENMLEGEITDLRSAGPLLHVHASTPLGDLLVAPPSWRPSFYPAVGQQIRLAWSPDAPWVVTLAS